MRKLILVVLVLVVLLAISAVAVYAGVRYDGDPPCGNGIWARYSITVLADEEEGLPADWSPDFKCRAKVKHDGGKAKAWLTNYEEDDEFTCLMEVAFTQGENGPVVAQAEGSCEKVEAEWESDD